MSKHTEGAWRVKPWTATDRDGAICSCGHQVVAVAADGSEVGIFCTAMEGDDIGDLHLIAAAPALLEALQYAIKQVPELGTVPGISAAIAAATGQGEQHD